MPTIRKLDAMNTAANWLLSMTAEEPRKTDMLAPAMKATISARKILSRNAARRTYAVRTETIRESLLKV